MPSSSPATRNFWLQRWLWSFLPGRIERCLLLCCSSRLGHIFDRRRIADTTISTIFESRYVPFWCYFYLFGPHAGPDPRHFCIGCSFRDQACEPKFGLCYVVLGGFFYLTVFSLCEYFVCSQPPFLPFVLPHVFNWQVVKLLIVDLKQFNKGGEDFHMNRFGFYFVLRIFAVVFHGTVAVYMCALVSVSIPSLPLFFPSGVCEYTLLWLSVVQTSHCAWPW